MASMAYAFKVNKITLFGTMYNGAEEWSTGFFLGHEDANVIPNTEVELEELYGYWTTFFGHFDTGISWAFQSTGVKCTHINADGTHDPELTKYYYPSSATAGGLAVTGFPPQVSLVASLLAGTGKGLGYKGRMYIPGVSQPIMGDGHMAWDKVEGIAAKFEDFVSAVNTSSGIWGHFINASKGRTTGITAPPINRDINEIRIGNVYDTQRRRRNGLPETYKSLPVTAG
jgi:hypothetical protein